ncbi:MAG: sensor domain-containing diguanylate cyclase, partial [Burkholderiales bacterium]
VMDQATLRALVVDSLEDQIAVVDQTGAIVDVNSAWEKFGLGNGLGPEYASLGRNYLEIARAAGERGDTIAAEAARGIRDVLNGERAAFYMEYPCHSPGTPRWFMMRVTRLKSDLERLFVISHHDITQRKLAEEHAEYLALHDPLTGLANRRHFEGILRREWRQSARDRMPISLVIFDLDCYKDYNDDLGHLAGDECLVVVSRVLQTYCRRPGDLAVRFGGDELGLLLGQTDLTDARRIAEEVRSAVWNKKLAYGNSRRITVSAGVASMLPGRNETEAALLREADNALYDAKRAGRNRVMCRPHAVLAAVNRDV